MRPFDPNKPFVASSDHIEILSITENIFGSEYAKIICNYKVKNEQVDKVHTQWFDVYGKSTGSAWYLTNGPELTDELFAEQKKTIEDLRAQNTELTQMLNKRLKFSPDLLDDMSDIIDRFNEELGR